MRDLGDAHAGFLVQQEGLALRRRQRFERATNVPAETVTILYDSYSNLLARGIIPAPEQPRRPGPNPFPGFVSDPPA